MKSTIPSRPRALRQGNTFGSPAARMTSFAANTGGTRPTPLQAAGSPSMATTTCCSGRAGPWSIATAWQTQMAPASLGSIPQGPSCTAPQTQGRPPPLTSPSGESRRARTRWGPSRCSLRRRRARQPRRRRRRPRVCLLPQPPFHHRLRQPRALNRRAGQSSTLGTAPRTRPSRRGTLFATRSAPAGRRSAASSPPSPPATPPAPAAPDRAAFVSPTKRRLCGAARAPRFATTLPRCSRLRRCGGCRSCPTTTSSQTGPRSRWRCQSPATRRSRTWCARSATGTATCSPTASSPAGPGTAPEASTAPHSSSRRKATAHATSGSTRSRSALTAEIATRRSRCRGRPSRRASPAMGSVRSCSLPPSTGASWRCRWPTGPCPARPTGAGTSAPRRRPA
mmetsp:Transcript_21210/g.68471  ORF Transcript_21210/g.68471 Transcript_21210/m.68471 type:complete len:395 (-) Transcript_21210:128-1312(-)